MSHLDDFIYQGTLPFVGRQLELDRLLGFWRATPQAQRLRASLVLAEAGIGKSRLLEEVIAAISREGGTVVHCKLYPESSISLAPLLARALWQSNVGHELLRSEPQGVLSSVVTAMRRLCRLRPTLLVVEDAHLLGGDALGELNALLSALADETLSMLALCRPLEWKGRGVLEPYLSERIEMQGLSLGSIGELWSLLFGEESASGIVEHIHRVTLGNGLAVRSSLRMALDSGFILHEPARGAWQVPGAEQGFIRMLEQSVGMISEGMVMHLNEQERRAAEHLALLGEVFSREAASLVIEDADRLIPLLMDKGILSTYTVTATPLAAPVRNDRHYLRISHRPASRFPLIAFTHSLLHRHFADRDLPQQESLFHIIGDDLPLYSLLPIQSLKEEQSSSIEIGLLVRTVERIMTIARSIDGTSEWPTAPAIFRTAEALIVPRLHETDDERYWRARLCQSTHWFRRRTVSNELRRETMLAHLELTEDPQTLRQARERMVALSEKVEVGSRAEAHQLPVIWEELERLFEKFPELQVTTLYANCLSAMLIVARQVRDAAMMTLIQDRVEEILHLETIDPEFRILVQLKIYPEYILIFDTAEELENRYRLLATLETLPRRIETTYEGRALDFLMHTGQFDRMLKMSAELITRARAHGHTVVGFIYQLNQLMGLGGFGMDLDKVCEVMYRAFEEIPPDRIGNMPRHAGEWMVSLGLLRGEGEWGEKMISNLIPDESDRAWVFRMLLDIEKGDFRRALDDLRADTQPNIIVDAVARQMLEPVLTMLVEETPVDPAGLIEAVRQGIVMPQLRVWNVLILRALVVLLEELGRQERHAHIVTELRPDIAAGLRSRLEWLAERSLFGFMRPLLEKHGEYLPAKERLQWQQRIEQIILERAVTPARRDRVRVGMLGTIQIAHADGEPEQLRGVRIRTLLGLLVADQMVGRTLSPREFVQIAGGGEEENPELARKKRNMAVVRLREAMGADAILTDEKTPRLNLERVEVDLLRADDLIKRALAAGREGALVRAQPLLIEALELTRGEVPFPTLYETFFEAAREDFEYRLRTAIIDIAQGLLQEGDAGGAEEILRRGFEAMPDDEQVAELLQEALRSRGNRMEAERIRLRSSREMRV